MTLRWKLLCLVLSMATFPIGAEVPAIRVLNHENGSMIRYPVPLLKGTLADGLTSLAVINTTSNRDTREMNALVHKGRFKALTELVPGENRLVLRAGDRETSFTICYKPQTSPYVVRIVYMTDSSGNTEYQSPLADDPQDYAAKLDTAMKLMQTFTAERLHDLGFGRHTFKVEYDENGKVMVHTIKGAHPAEHYYSLEDGAWWGELHGWIDRLFPTDKARYILIAAYTRFDPATRRTRGHTALGGGAMALFGSGNLFTWPSRLQDVFAAFMNDRRIDTEKVFSDSAGRDAWWAGASTTIGATLHELSHTFGLPHSSDGMDIMTRGFDHFNRAFTFMDPPSAHNATPIEFAENEIACFAPASASNLRATRWLTLDARPFADSGGPEIGYDEKSNEFVIAARQGVRFVGLNVQGDVRDHLAFIQNEQPPKEVRLSLDELKKRLGTADARIRAIDSEGQEAGADAKALAMSPRFIRQWRFAAITKPWNRNAFVELTADDLAAIEASASSAPLAAAKEAFVDFQPCFEGNATNVAAYAVRRIVTDQPRKIKILAGSDDALRVWVNGAPAIQTLALRAAEPDQDSATVELRAGENTLVAEVSQADGGWGLFMRLEDENGHALLLAEDGRLKEESL